MRLAKLPHDTRAVAEFLQDALESLGAVCERTWFDRLHVLAEGRAAALWPGQGELVDQELRIVAPEESGPRDAAREVFPGCPLVFHLAEAIGSGALTLQRAVLRFGDQERPAADVAEKLWRAQYPGASRWFLETPFQASWHFSLLVLARCEIQAIDQHWSLHRLALACPRGEPDDDLARALQYAEIVTPTAEQVRWPSPDPVAWQERIRAALLQELDADLGRIRQRQENYLRRELDRIDDYFASYAKELRGRLERQHAEPARARLEQRLTAAQAEHERRRTDQVQRHEVRVVPYLDALVLLAERAWQATMSVTRQNVTSLEHALFLPRTRRWLPHPPGPGV